MEGTTAYQSTPCGAGQSADDLAKAGTVQRHTARPPAAQAYRFGPHAHPEQGSPPRCADTPAPSSLVSAAAAAGVSTGWKDA